MRFKDAERRAAFVDELSSEIARLVARYHDDRAAGGRTFKVVVGSYPSPTAAGAPGVGAATPGHDPEQVP